MAASSPEMITPLYSAPMTLPPSLALTNEAPITEATIDTAPNTRG